MGPLLFIQFEILDKLTDLYSQVDALDPIKTSFRIFLLKVGCEIMLSLAQLNNPGIRIRVEA